VVYGGEDGPDLVDVAHAGGLDPAAVIEAHAGVDYVVYMLGFLPGFPFMGDVPPALRLPRRSEPRVRVPAGSVAIATGLTAIYPWESPGGWHLLGRCPAPLFDPSLNPPALLAAGDRVRFMPVTIEAMAGIEADLRAGRLDAQQWAQS
jgi:KipI family sensor histidine kinase inhibitor